MLKVTLDLNSKQVEQMVERLPVKDKLRLVRKLEQQTLRERWRTILKDIDSRLKKFPISKEEVLEEIKSYRKQKHA